MTPPDNLKPHTGEAGAADRSLTTELLVLPDGRILVHNLTPAFAGLLSGLNPDDEQIASRVPWRKPGPPS